MMRCMQWMIKLVLDLLVDNIRKFPLQLAAVAGCHGSRGTLHQESIDSLLDIQCRPIGLQFVGL